MSGVVVCDISNMNATVKEIDPAYMAGTVAWNDGARGVSAGALTAFGSNITDARIEAQDGGFVPFVRPNNLDELLGVTTADEVHLVDNDGSSLTLDDVLVPEKLMQRARYMGYTSIDIPRKSKRPVVLRFQHAFVGLDATGHRSVVPTHYSYQTSSRDDPKNLILLATSQGITVQCDDAGQNKLFAHSTDASGATVNKWFDVTATQAAVGHAASSAGTTTKELGVKGMGARENCFVLINIPCKQQNRIVCRGWQAEEGGEPRYRSLAADDVVCRSARVSYGATAGATTRNEIALVVDDDAPIVLTVMCYNTVDNPVKNRMVSLPKDSIRLAVEDMTRCLALCKHSCKLSELACMLHKLTTKDMALLKDTIEFALPSAYLPASGALQAFA